MQPGFAVSTGVHVALLAVSILGLTAARPLDAGQTEAMPIELITPTEYDQLTKGAKTSKVLDKPPQIKTAKVADADPEEKADLKEAKQEVKAPPPPPPPTPEPKMAEQTPPPPPKPAESKPEPPKPPEAKPQQVSEDALPKQTPAEKQRDEQKPDPKPEQQKAEQKPEPPKPPVKTPPPPKKTAEQKPPPKPPERTFSADKIAALLDKREPVRTASASREMMETTTAGTARGTASKLSISQRTAIEGMMREQISPCWNPPIGAAGAEDMKVTIRFQLNSDGTLDGEPSVVQWQSSAGFQAAADSALRAVRRCSPLHLPAEAYDYWRDVQINFDPKDMLGG